MATSSRKAWLVAGAALLLLGLLLVVLTRGGGRPAAALRVKLVTDGRTVIASGHVALRAEATGGGTLTFAWSTTSGHLRGQGAAIELAAPARAGQVTVTVVVTRDDGARAEASLTLTVSHPAGDDGEVAAAPPLGDNGALPGYAIETIEFDKTSMCLDDDVLVRVTAKDPDGSSRWLVPRVRVADRTADGPEAIAKVGPAYRAFPQHYPDGGKAVVEIFDVRTNRIVARHTAPYELRDCETEDRGVDLACTPKQDGATPDLIECRVRQIHDTSFVPASYAWRLGLERTAVAPPSTATTAQPRVVLTSPPRVEDRTSATYIAEVQVTATDGRTRTGRASVLVPNQLWQHAESVGVLRLAVSAPPIARPAGERQVVLVGTVTNPAAEAITLQPIREVHAPCARPEAADAADTIAPVALLGTTRLAPGQRVPFRWVLADDASRCGASLLLTGRGDKSGLPAEGRIDLITDPRFVKTTSDETTAWVREGLAVLAKERGVPVDTISQVELDRLVKQGRLRQPPAP